MAKYTGTPLYPLFLDLHQREVVVIGAGNVAEHKVHTLLESGAHITVIAPQASNFIETLAQEKRIVWHKRSYQSGDITNMRLCICACGVPEVNQEVYKEAMTCGALINVVDRPEQCEFYVPSHIRRGPLQIAISTTGTAPTVAKRIKADLAEQYGELWEDYLLLLGEVRGLVMARVPGSETVRKPLFEALAESDLEHRILSGEKLSAEDVYARYLSPLLSKNHTSLACTEAINPTQVPSPTSNASCTKKARV